MTYPKVSTGAHRAVSSTPNFPEIEERVLAYWKDDDTFRASVEQREAGEDGANEFVFYDGPPFANGLPHYGHLLTGYVKDLIPRYQTMRGRRVERRFGWDTHGLPAELEAMRQLGMKTTQEILDLGIEQFNAECRESVFQYTQEWRDYVDPAGALGRLRPRLQDPRPRLHGVGDVGLQAAVGQGPGLRGLPGAALLLERRDPAVRHELRMDDDVYQPPAGPRGHRRPAAHRRPGRRRAGAGLDDDAVDPAANLGIMVGPDIDYVVVESDHTGTTERYLLGAARLAAYARELGESPEVVARLHRRGARRQRVHAADVLLRGPRERPPRLRGRVRHHRRRHRAGAHRRRLR